VISALALRVAALFCKQADQPPGARQDARQRTRPVNKPRGISPQLVKDNGESRAEGEDVTKPHHRDIQPKDVFSPTPNNLGVLNLAETGKDLSRALDRQVPKDKGYDEVSNLSQYLLLPGE
jgi:hypothetical protein